MTDDSKIVAMPGRTIPVPKGEPVPSVVAELERLLGEAKGGQLVALGVAYVIDDGTASRITDGKFCGRDDESYTLFTAAGELMYKLNRQFFSD